MWLRIAGSRGQRLADQFDVRLPGLSGPTLHSLMNIALRRSLFVLAAGAWLSAIGPAYAARLFFSSSATSPTEKNTSANASLSVVLGQNVSLYLWAEMGGDRFTGLSHDIVSSNPRVERVGTAAASYLIDNPSIDDSPRWTGAGAGGGAATFLIDDSNLVRLAGSHLGGGRTLDPTYDAATNTYRVARLNLRGIAVGSTEIRLGVGTNGITYTGAATTISFGFGDNPVSGSDKAAVSTTADAVIQVISAWQNPVDRFDVNQSGEITPLDALLVINELNEDGPYTLPIPTLEFGPPPFWDVSGNGSIEPLDALQIIDFIDPTGSATLDFAVSSAEMAVPEPATAWLMGLGSLALAGMKYRRRRREIASRS